jgi:hypothetical protein
VSGADESKIVILLREQNDLLLAHREEQIKSSARLDALCADMADIKLSIREDRHGERIRVIEANQETTKFWVRCIGSTAVGAFLMALFELIRHKGGS